MNICPFNRESRFKVITISLIHLFTTVKTLWHFYMTNQNKKSFYHFTTIFFFIYIHFYFSPILTTGGFIRLHKLARKKLFCQNRPMLGGRDGRK